MSLTSWFLVSGSGTRHRLPREMIFVGRDDCELMLQSRSVDKQHAVINYEADTDEHKVKDLGSLNGTFVNDVRVQEQMYVTLKIDDKLRFELHIPEEALKVRLPLHMEKCCNSYVTVLHRGTPLYGQPAWWGDGDADNHSGRPEENNSERTREKPQTDTKKSAEMPKSALQLPSTQEPSYFEIPTKDGPQEGKAIGEATFRDQEAAISSVAEPVHGHASYTIEFDPGASGKVTVKDRVAKLGLDTRPRPKRGVGEELSPLQTAMVAAEVKVADWLAQNELPLTVKETAAEDGGESVKSDVPVQLRSLKDSKHEDGTQSDSENALGEQRRVAALEERPLGLWGGAGMKIREGRANVPEGLFAEEESPARRRRSSSTKVPASFVERQHSAAPHQQSSRDECYQRADDGSDRGTYTIDLENGDHEEEEARKMIDKVGKNKQHVMSLSLTCSVQMVFPPLYNSGILPEELVVGGPRWVSQWAILAASHIRTDPEGSGGESQTDVSKSSHYFASSGQKVPDEEGGRRTPSCGMHTDMGEKQDTELQEKESQRGKTAGEGILPAQGSPSRSSSAKSQGSSYGRTSQTGAMTKLPPRPKTSGERRIEEVQKRKKEERIKETIGKPFLRQESFTVEKPSSNVPIELIPRIDGLTGSRPPSREAAIDSDILQKDSEAVAAFLETTVSDQGDPPSQSIEGSMSPESDVDTTSTVSQADGARKMVQKRRILVGQQKQKTVVSSNNKGAAAGRETQDKRVKTRTHGLQHPWTSLDLTDDDINSNSLLCDTRPTTQETRGSRARTQTESTTVGASTKSSRAKINQAPASLPASKTTSAPKPRPTRASILRRARLGDSTDTEPVDLDRMSVASEASTTSSTSRTGLTKRGMSRIEALAQPRRPRVGSPSAQSDSEATVTRSRGLGARSTAGDYAIRHGLRGSNVTSACGPRARANSASKLPDKSKPISSYGQATPAGISSTRWRRVPVEYASTSEDEYGSNRHMSKQGQARPVPATRVAQLGGSGPTAPNSAGLKPASRDQDEYMRDWTAHSEEIARISQDLAKDLAMLAREIHDVAGEIDSVSPAATDPGVVVLSKYLTVVDQQNMDVVECDDRLDQGGPSTDHSTALEANGKSVEMRQRSSNPQGSRSIRRQTWNRDEAMTLDSLLLPSVNQLSNRIRQSVDKTANKIRILFKDKDRKWEEIESTLQAEHDSLLLKSSNKVKILVMKSDVYSFSSNSIVCGLKEKIVSAVIDMMVDPDGTLDALTSLGLTSPLADQKGPATHQAESAPTAGGEASSRALLDSRHEVALGESHGLSECLQVAQQVKGSPHTSG
uniref:Centrosomal protein of 170 kDa-like n=1 Tax=Hippocampus comes TaxID=109280 RepID=A0A3Q2YIA1_HIPCM